MELLEWRLREERALVDELQSCLQRQHQTKLQLIGRLCDVVADPAARASQVRAGALFEGRCYSKDHVQ